MNTVRHILQIKGTDIWTIAPDETVFEALRTMAKKDVGALIVMENDHMVGIISERDYARKVILQGRSSRDTKVREIMTSHVHTVHPDQTVEECMDLMTRYRVRHLPVIENDRLVGVISIGDVLYNIIQRQRQLISKLEDKVMGKEEEPSEPAVPGEKILVHTPVTEGIAGMPIPLKAQVPATLGAARVVVLFRAEGAKEYSTLEMDPVENSDLYQCQIPAEATSGSMVTYTLVVYGDRGQVLAQAGSLSEPYVIALGEGGPLDESGGISEAVPEAGGDSEEEGGTGLWLSLGVRRVFGYHSGQPEANRTDDSGQKLTSSGVAMSQLLHITPELGFFATDSLLLSLQGRLQMVSGASTVKGSLVQKNPDACGGGTCHPASFAVAVLAKATWFLGDPRTVMPFFSLAAGGGQIRQVVGVGKLSGCPSGGCKDTVVGGPVLLGVGGGVSIELSGSFSAVVGANAVMGLPKIMANLDLNLSLAYLY